MESNELKLIVEALLMSSPEPLTLEQMKKAFAEWEQPTDKVLKLLLEELAKDYENRAIELKSVASGYCLQTKIQYSAWVSRLQSEKPVKYSRAILETLAIIAYRQPVTRADIEEIRGVAVSTPILKSLLEREWIKIAGYRDVPGKPAVYMTTKGFLDYFNLTNLSQLPALDEHSLSADPLIECIE